MSERRARVKVKGKKPVTRAQAAAEFGRKKLKQRRQMVKRRILLGSGGLMIGYVAISTLWALHTGQLQQSVGRTEQSFWNATASLGFRVDQVTLTGRKHASAAAVKAALGVAQGAPILAYPLADMKARLEAIPEVKSASISRVLPNRISIVISERLPVAWWQKDGVQQLVDAEGIVLERKKYAGVRQLPVVVGPDAPKHVGELIALLDTTPALKPDIVAAVRVGERRWNVELKNDVVVMLPEQNAADAWKRFATLVEKEALLSKAIRSVDMRVEDRVFIMPVEQDKSPITLTSARDT